MARSIKIFFSALIFLTFFLTYINGLKLNKLKDALIEMSARTAAICARY